MGGGIDRLESLGCGATPDPALLWALVSLPPILGDPGVHGQPNTGAMPRGHAGG